MIRLLLLAMIIFAGLFLGPMLMDQKGYVLIAINDWTIESSVVVLVMVVLVFYACLQLFEWAVVNTLTLWGRTRHWFGWRKHQLAQQKTLTSLLDLAGGRFALAEKNSARYAELSEQPMLNYLTAANAAQQMGKTDLRDKYLASAASLKSDDSALVATRLKMLVDDNDPVATAQWLSTQPARTLVQPEILALVLPIYCQTKQWDLVLSTASQVYKNKYLTAQQFEAIEIDAHQALLGQSADDSLDELHRYYKKLHRKLRNNIDIFFCYAKLVIKLKGIGDIENLVFKFLRKEGNHCLITLLLNADDAQKYCDKLLQLESTFKHHVSFYCTIAKLYADLRQWELAKTWYIKAIECEPKASLYHQLALVQQELGEQNGALNSFNKALEY